MAGQWLNTSAVRGLFSVIRQPGLTVPHVHVAHIGHLNFHRMRQMGVRGVILDKDNTLTAPYASALHPLVARAFEECRAAFGRDAVILSNSAGTPDDPGHREASALEDALGLPVLRHSKKKPDCADAVAAHYGTSVPLHRLCAIGDRLLTDVVFGNMHGMLTIHTQLLTPTGDNPLAAAVRRMENALILPCAQHLVGACPTHRVLGPRDMPQLVQSIANKHTQSSW